jgi:hypothetical protein
LHYVFVTDIAVTDGARLGDIGCRGEFFAVNPIFNWDIFIGEVPDMGFMYESDMVREAMNPFPVDRRICFKGSSYFFDLCLGGDSTTVNVFMAEEARFHSRNCGCLSFGYVSVAELTLNVVLCNVGRVGEGHRLIRGVAKAKRRVGKPGDE